MNRIPVAKLAMCPTGMPVGDPEKIQSRIFFISSTKIPATGPIVMAAINAGMSLKSICRNAGNQGSGKLNSIKINEMLLNIAIVTNARNLLFVFVIKIFSFADSISQEERYIRPYSMKKPLYNIV